MKRIIILTLVIVSLLVMSIVCVNSVSNYDLSIFRGCNNLYVDNNNSGSYLFGFNNKTLYSFDVFTNKNIRYVTCDGVIRCACQNGVNTYALFEEDTLNYQYTILELNMNDGSCNYYTFTDLTFLDSSSVAVGNNEVYFMIEDSHYTYVISYSFTGEKVCEYKFNDEVTDLFVNNSNVYARLYGGEIYKLTNATYNLCANIKSQSEFSNAGKGFIYTDYGKLISLDNDVNYSGIKSELDCVNYDRELLYTSNNTIISNEKYYDCPSDIKKLLVDGDNIAVLLSDYTCKTIDVSELKEYKTELEMDTANLPYEFTEDIIYGVESGTSVKEFKTKFSGNINVFNSGGEKVTSGLMKTGYRTVIAGQTYYISVRGDITGEGNVKSNDISTLMSVFTQKTSISGEYYQSADYDLNGVLDNRDLVLIAQKYEAEK